MSRPTYKTGTIGTYIPENFSTVPYVATTYPTFTSSTIRGTTGCAGGSNVESYFYDAGSQWATALTTTCGLTTRTWNRDHQLSTSVVDVRGNLLSGTDTGGHETEYTYNVRDQLTEVEDPAGNTTTYTYANWNVYGPTQIDDPDHGVSYLTYDDHGRLARSLDARLVDLGFGYDDANRLRHVWHVTTGGWLNVAERKYDFPGALGHLGEEISWNRDTNGNSAGQTKVSYTYDNRGRTDSVTHTIPGLPGGPQTVSYDYYEHNQPHKIHYPKGVQVEYGYDRQGRPRWMGLKDTQNTSNPNTRTVVLYAEYNAADQITVLKRRHAASPGALNSYYSYYSHDGSLRANYTDSGSGTPLDQYYKYDYSDAGKMWSLFETSPGGSTKSCFWWTSENWLNRAWTLGNSTNCQTVGTDNAGPEPYEVDYDYDNLGRITNATGTETVGGNYTYGTNVPLHAPTGAGANTYTYDAAGNRASVTLNGQTTNYAHDVQDRLISTSGADAAAMLYDANGERVERTINGTTDYYLASGLELNSSGGQTIALGFAGRTVGTYTHQRELWSQSADHLGSPTFSVNIAGTDEHYRRYTPFGSPRSGSSSAGAPVDLTFTAQRDDTGLGLMYYGTRYYDPAVGQFVQPDSVGADGGNAYGYVRNNPLRYVDPFGLCASMIDGSVCSFRRTTRSRTIARHETQRSIARTSLASLTSSPPTGISTTSVKTSIWLAQTFQRDENTAAPEYHLAKRLIALSIITKQVEKKSDGALVPVACGGCEPAQAELDVHIMGSSDGSVMQLSLLTAETFGVGARGGLSALKEPSAASIISRTAQTQSQRGVGHLKGYLSRAEQAAYNANPQQGSRFLGQAAHRATADALDEAYPGRFIYRTQGPDFVDTTTGELIELTTRGQLASHVAKPGYGRSMSYSLYDLPAP